MKTDQNPDKTPKGKGLKILALGLLLAAACTGGYFAWKKFKGKEEEESTGENDSFLPSSLPNPALTPYIPPRTTTAAPKLPESSFPLKPGSKGTKVKELQNALIARYGASVLPKYGADGDFGNETTEALKQHGWPDAVDENTFNTIVSSAQVENMGSDIDVKEVAEKLADAAINSDFTTALAQLKKINTPKEYQDVSNGFKAFTFLRYSTLLDGMFKAFSSASQKDQLRQQFLRMGLKNNGSTWSVSGIEQPVIITLHDTTVWEQPDKRIQVEGNTILGTAIQTRNGYTLFQTIDGQHQLLVKTSSIKSV